MSVSSHQPMSSTDWLMLGGISILWGGSFMFTAIAVRDIPPVTLVLARTLLGGLTLLMIARALGHEMPRQASTWAGFFVLGLFGNLIPFSLIAFGQTSIPAGLAAILNATTPLGTVIVLWLARGEGIGWIKAAGLALGVLGVAILLGPKVADGQQTRLIGALAVLGASASYAVAGVWAMRFKSLPPAVTSSGSLLGASLMGAPIVMIMDRPWTLSPPPEALLSVAALGFVSTGLAYLMFYRILNRAGPTNASLVTFLVPVSAILLGALVLGERLDTYAFIGMAVIFAGLAAIDGRLFRRRPVPVPAEAD